jgi:hypothetical protein
MRTPQDRQSGQMLVLLALALVALMAIAGLAIDGGMAIVERRRMQNAADAAALAATRLLAEAICRGPGSIGDSAIATEVNIQAEQNGVRDSDGSPGNAVNANVHGVYVNHALETIGQVGQGYIPASATGIAVTAEITRTTYLIRLVGIDTAGASGYALGMAGPPFMVEGTRPFGVPMQLVDELEPGDEFRVSFKNSEITWATGQSQHRGWMNLAYVWNVSEDPDFPRAIDDGIGSSTLAEWMASGWQGTLYVGDYVHAKPGTDSSPVCNAPEGIILYAPIYGEMPDCPTEIPEPKPECPTQGGSYCYHIIGFAGVRILGCDQGSAEISAELVRTIMAGGVPQPQEGYGYGEPHACDAHTMAVALYR